MQIYDAVDFAGDGVVHTLAFALGLPASGNNKAKWFQVSDVAIVGAVPARLGSSAISTSRGIPIKPYGGQFSPPIAELTDTYDLNAIYLLVQSGDTVSVARGI